MRYYCVYSFVSTVPCPLTASFSIAVRHFGQCRIVSMQINFVWFTPLVAEGVVVRLMGRCCKRLAWAVLIVGVCLSVYAENLSVETTAQAEDQNLEADILLGAARNAVKLGDLKTAIQRFAEFQRLYPDREDGRRGYADALFQAGRAREAAAEYEWLIKRHPNDPKLIRVLVDALLNVGDNARAKRLLVDALKRFPARVDFALSLASLYAQDGEIAEADQLVQKYIVGRPLTSRRMQLEAASIYIQLRRPNEAGPIVAELLKSDPDNAKVLALSVRYALLTNDHQQAIRQAAKLDRLYPGNVDLRLELASALYTAGNYAEAGRLFKEVLQKSPNNKIALLGSARVALRDYRVELADSFLEKVKPDIRGRQWQLATVERDTIAGNYFRAHSILDQLLQENPKDTQASLALADLNRAAHEFIKADCLYQAAGATADNSMAGEHYAMSLFLESRYCEAEALCHYVLVPDPKNVNAMMILARILIKTNRCQEAVDWVRKTQKSENNVYPECVYFANFISPESGPCKVDKTRPLYLAVTLFHLAMENGRRMWAKEILDEALCGDPCNVMLRTMLAEWYASFGLPEEASCAAEIYAELLAQEPINQKWMLGLARANVNMRCYDEALAIYRSLRCESPDNYLYARETARVVYFVCGSPYGVDEYDSILCGWSGLQEEACRLSRERCAKTNHLSSPSVAAGAYEGLLAQEPYEPHIAFELGQVYGLLGNTSYAIGAYSHLLSIHPNHRDAKIAIVGKRLKRCQELLFDHRFVRERGRDGLTSIDRLGEYTAYQLPRVDENEHLSIGYGRLTLAPTNGIGTTGNALAIKFQKQSHWDFGPWLSPYAPVALFIDCEVQQYDRLVATRPVFEAGLKIRAWDDLICTISGTMDNILENGESLRQDIYRGGLRSDLLYMPNNYWETELTYEFQSYSDVNTRHAAEFRNRLQLTPDPRRFTFLADFYYWNIADASVFSPGPDPFLDMIHPYWTPQDYYMGGVGLEWKEWLSWDRFDGAQHCWVSFSLMKRWDNQSKNYTIYRGMLGWDITRRLSGYALGEYNEGSPYQGTWAYGGLAWKF